MPGSGVLSAGVLLELGARGGTLPSELMAVRSLVAEHGRAAELDASFEESAPFEIRVLHPTRTLVEKLMILHHAAVVDDKDERTRAVRDAFEGQVLDQLVWGAPEEKPTLDDCCDLVQSLAARL